MSRNCSELCVPSRQEDHSKEGGHQTVLWRSQSVLLDVRNEVVNLVDEKRRNTKDACDTCRRRVILVNS